MQLSREPALLPAPDPAPVPAPGPAPGPEPPEPPPAAASAADFTAFYAATWPRLYRTAYGITRDAAAAEDALQSAYAKAFASWRRIAAVHQPEAYVRRMVVNEVLGTKRWSRRRPEQLTDRVESLPHRPVSDTGAEHARRDALWTALGALAPRQRAVLVLRYYEDLSEAEIADVLRCSRGTVKSQASAALANLRRVSGLTEGNAW